MKIVNRIKKLGFSLMELTLAVLIVAILILITLPIINRQLEKSEEYSYYMAYKSVEKLAGQIVALGDDKEDAYVMAPQKLPFNKVLLAKFNDSKFRVVQFISKYKNRLAFSETYIFSKLFPKAMAETITINLFDWNNFSYDDVWMAYHVCKYAESKGTTTVRIDQKDYIRYNSNYSDIPKGKYKITKNGVEEEVTQYHSIYDYDCCAGYTQKNTMCLKEDNNGQYVEAGSDDVAPYVMTISGKKYKLVTRSEYTNVFALRRLMFKDGVCQTSDSDLTSVANTLKNISYSGKSLSTSAKNFCEDTFKTKCNPGSSSVYKIEFKQNDGSSGGTYYKNSDDGVNDGPDDEEDKAPHSSITGSCVVTKTEDFTPQSYENTAATVERPQYSQSWCDNYTSQGHKVYYNMTNAGAPYSIDCQPKSGYVVSANNEKYADAPCPTGKTLYAVFNSSTNTYSRLCAKNDFNEYKQEECEDHSVYSGGETCECVSGWNKDATGKCTVKGECPKGTKEAADHTCVANPPIVKAKRFCELITENWNVDKHKCDTFENGVYSAVFNAAKSNDNKYLSINSKIGAFKDITPNIVLANGLRIWILGDKAASITGLSYYADTVSSRQNMCERVNLLTAHTKEECSAQTGNKGYFCANDKNCFKLDDSSYATGTRTIELKDARGCCAGTDFNDFYAMATSIGTPDRYLQDPTVYAIGGYTIFVDINGSKGEGTLWEDVFPFFISSNGKVYPGYPLDSQKGNAEGDTNTSLYLGGNSDKQLPVDVYYYETSASGDAREKKIAFANVSFARAMCSARQMNKFTPYCMNVGKKYKGKGIKKTATGFEEVDLPADYIASDATTSYNPCDYHRCYVSVKKKLRFF